MVLLIKTLFEGPVENNTLSWQSNKIVLRDTRIFNTQHYFPLDLVIMDFRWFRFFDIFQNKG